MYQDFREMVLIREFCQGFEYRYNKASITEVKLTVSITLDLPPKIEALLRQRAETTGQDISQWSSCRQVLGRIC